MPNPFRQADEAIPTASSDFPAVSSEAGSLPEAPETFSVAEPALWDGRPSLGGVWVAHPDVNDPERVVIRDPATGRSTTGALFRRERATPGPQLQVSSEAAEALGLVAGQPTVLEVVALARAEAETVPEDTPADPQSGQTGPKAASPDSPPPTEFP